MGNRRVDFVWNNVNRKVSEVCSLQYVPPCASQNSNPYNSLEIRSMELYDIGWQGVGAAAIRSSDRSHRL
ncbi:hypothetical protein ACI65C_007836 [Semiaphis heraclei]